MRQNRPRDAKRTARPDIPEVTTAEHAPNVKPAAPSRGQGPSQKITVRLRPDLLSEALACAGKLGLDLAAYVRSSLAVRVQDQNAALAMRQLRERLTVLQEESVARSLAGSGKKNGDEIVKTNAYTDAIEELDEISRRFKL